MNSLLISRLWRLSSFIFFSLNWLYHTYILYHTISNFAYSLNEFFLYANHAIAAIWHIITFIDFEKFNSISIDTIPNSQCTWNKLIGDNVILIAYKSHLIGNKQFMNLKINWLIYLRSYINFDIIIPTRK